MQSFALLALLGAGALANPLTHQPSTNNHRIAPRPDSHYDHVVHGSQSNAKWTDGKNRTGLHEYKLRVKENDPQSLGVDSVKQYSGYLDNHETDNHLFYWFFESRNDPANDPVVLWLTGGPGCSSMAGLFAENGPSSVQSDGSLKRNPYSWNNNASVVYLDQPVNVGFSYSNTQTTTTKAAAKDVYAFLSLFFKTYPQYAKQGFHVSGESYGGHYVPAVTAEILRQEPNDVKLLSSLVGNGLVDPLTQYAYYEPMACGQGGWPSVLDQGTCQSMKSHISSCQQKIQACYQDFNSQTCGDAESYCNNYEMNPYEMSGYNVYDVTTQCGDNCPPSMTPFTNYLNQKSVQEALGAEPTNFQSCNMNVYQAFTESGDWMAPIGVRSVPEILSKIPFLVYAGDEDFICNWLGNHAWTEKLAWPGKEGFNAQNLTEITISGSDKKLGQVKHSDGFAFLRVYKAGHMVPFYQPESALDMLNRWLSGEWTK